MASVKVLLVITIVACFAQQYYCQQATCTSTSSGTSCQIPVSFFDHAPNYMNHSRWNASWWAVNNFYDWPSEGSCGTANGGLGWPNSNFEFPLFILQDIPCCNRIPPIVNGEKNLVGALCTRADGQGGTCGTLASDRTPIYNYPGASPLGQVTSPASFNQFFHLVQETMQVPYNLTLTQDPVNPALRSFNNLSFFPLDGRGWNDWGAWVDSNNVRHQHNYGFCMVMNTHFTYQGGEYFHFLGDDDVYAYINNYLIMDLGGVHTALNASIYTDNLHLTPNVTYRFDLFYCERHTTSSEITFSTTINFFCAYTDWCGVCDGDGQSCCGDVCNDNNPCTTDYCDVHINPALDGGCHHNATVCPPSTPCLNSFCSMTTGLCTTTPVVCNDNNACTTDTCGSAGCSYLPLTNCSSTNQCVTTGCNPATGCTSTPITCNDNNKCTNDVCNPSIGCQFTNIPCNNQDACHTASCTPSGGCVQTLNPPCNDNNVCTTDSCDSVKGCIFTPIPNYCPASDQCNTWTCNPTSGCQNNKTSCPNPDACTTGTCNPSTGCSYTKTICTNGNACFNTACNPASGQCVLTPKAPCASQSCETVVCNNQTGCVYTPQVCATQNCSIASCSNNVCTYTPTTGAAGCGPCGGGYCNTSDPCNPQKCVNNVCTTSPYSCDDKNPCTNDQCVNSGGSALCEHTAITCNFTDFCTPVSCSAAAGGCVYQNISCDDGNACTTDSCVNGTTAFSCSNIPIVCTSSDNFCNPMKCSLGQCVNDTLPDCSDGNPCTQDICSNGACSNPLTCPNSGTPCNPIVCINGSCITQSVNCSSGNLCAVDSCDPGTGDCLHTPVDCHGTTCAPSYCNATNGQCDSPPEPDCNDQNPCTLDAVECTDAQGFFCNNTDMSWTCNDDDVCTNDFCNASSASLTTEGACYHTNITCTAPTVCSTVSGCDARNGCVIVPLVCAQPADWCQIAICDEVAGCITVARACAPEDNYCYQGFCNNVTRQCTQVQRPNWQTITNQQGVTCLLFYSPALKAGLTTGIIAAIVIAAVVAAALIAIAGKKGVDVFLASRAAPLGPSVENPLYAQHAGTGQNLMYKSP